MFNYLQSRIRGTASNGPGAPPDGLVRFYWHFVSQTKRWYGAMFVTSLAVALIDTVIPVFIGKLVSLMEATNRQAAIAREWPILAGMVALVLLVRPLLILIDIAIRQNALIPGATSLIRWQSHWHVVRQSWTFFQNDFAGRMLELTGRIVRQEPTADGTVVDYWNGLPDGEGALTRKIEGLLAKK